MLAIAARNHQAQQIVFVPWRKRKNQKELRLRAIRERSDNVRRINGFRPESASVYGAADIPKVFLVVERFRISHVKGTVDLGLRSEDEFRIADMPTQIFGQRRCRQQQIREESLVSLNDWIARLKNVQPHCAV